MTKKLTISVRVHISLEDIESLLDSAGRSTTYWASGTDALIYESTVRKILYQGLFLKVKLLDDELNNKDRGFHLDLAKVKKGLTVMAKKEPAHFADLLKGDADQITADVFIQCALLGEVIYS